MTDRKHLTIKTLFKGLYFVGCGMAFLGLFFDFYAFQGVHHAEGVVVAWNYNLFAGWTSSMPATNLFNFQYRPAGFALPVIIPILLLCAAIGSLFSLVLRGLDSTENLRSLMPYGYIHAFLLLLVGFYAIAFPLFFLVPNGLHFPVLTLTEEGTGVVFLYSVGLGYLMEVAGFLLIFPYITFYIHTIRSYELTGRDPTERIIADALKKSQKPLDIGQELAQERISLELTPIQRQKKIEN